uniref:Nucleotidyl transferase domain-containing protein n=1 Tax=Oryza meridionalis TaxID=40149 RepID=A0A0E0CXY7_9ORYZ
MAGSEQRVVAVIMVGGPTKGTRFRPLSLNVPKPLFPLAGQPMVHHPISACRRIPNLAQIYLVGFYEEREFAFYVSSISNELRVPPRDEDGEERESRQGKGNDEEEDFLVGSARGAAAFFSDAVLAAGEPPGIRRCHPCRRRRPPECPPLAAAPSSPAGGHRGEGRRTARRAAQERDGRRRPTRAVARRRPCAVRRRAAHHCRAVRRPARGGSREMGRAGERRKKRIGFGDKWAHVGPTIFIFFIADMWDPQFLNYFFCG